LLLLVLCGLFEHGREVVACDFFLFEAWHVRLSTWC
jgi:hypothetical protein